MRMRRTAGAAALAAGVVTATAFGAGGAAQAAPQDGSSAAPVPVVNGLSGPFGLDTFKGGFVVAQAGGGETPSQVTWIGKKGGKKVLFDDAQVSGVTAGALRVWSVTGEDQGGPSSGEEPQNLRAMRQGPYPFSSVLKTHVKKGQTSVLANLLAYELHHNPDGQTQFDPETGAPYDALSNPFAITKYWRGLLVADGGANDVLLVNARTGRVSTFFVPPTVPAREVEACGAPEAQANPGTQGCDPVPTGVTVHGKSVYVSTLGAEAPGAGKIYKLNAKNGAIQKVWDGLDAPTGVVVGPDGSIYYSQVLQAPEGEGPPGRVTRIAPNGAMTFVDLPMPVGLTMRGSHLFSTDWALGGPEQGQIVEIPASAFHVPVAP